MGQNSSQLGSSSPRRRVSSPARRKAPPTPAPPPKPPAYVVAENCVLPGGATDMAGARKLLRPVSQELTKFHPDFADIFAYDSEVDALPREGGESSEAGYFANRTHGFGDRPRLDGVGHAHLTDVTPLKYQHGANKPGEVALSNGSATDSNANQLNKENKEFNFSGESSNGSQQPKGSGTSLRRTQSMETRPRLQAGRNQQGKFHRRQLSVTPVIPEDPREHLYNITRNEPFSNAQPSSASLPLASSFGLDYSFNVTYAQLADFRRKQREEEMGEKMDELSAEIKASSTVPKSPFDRTNIGEKSATRSVSTGSSETGVSKSKKKKAPAPPPPANVPPLTRSRDQSPGKVSMTTEPPADYDMGTDLSPAHSPPSSARALHRSFSSAGEYESRDSPSTDRRLRERNAGQDSNPQPAPAVSQPPPPPPPAPPLPGTPGALKFPPSKDFKSSNQAATTKTEQKPTTVTNQTGLQKSVAEAKAQVEELKRLREILLNGKSPKESEVSAAENTATTPDKDSEQPGSIKLPTLASSDEPVKEDKPDSSSKVSTPRMSSLLQHDIVLAAQARGAKVVKAKPPLALEKPKDMAEMFREELAKAALAREERRSREVANEDFDNNNNSKEGNHVSKNDTGDHPSFIFQSSFLKVTKKPPQTMAKPDLKTLVNNTESQVNKNNDKIKTDMKNETAASDLTKRSLWIPDIEDREERDSSIVSKRSSIQSEDMSISSSNASQRVFLPSWTPEHDLDSDDDIMNESSPPFGHVFGESRTDPSTGFKSSVLPTKIDSLKKDKSKKKKERSGDSKERKLKGNFSSPSRQQIPEDAENDQKFKTESGEMSSSDKDEKKLGNLRKFHKGVKQAFGSISKASGKLLKRRKSQDILEIPTDISSNSQHHSGVSTDPNWTLGDSASNAGSLRRVASEGHMPVQAIYQNGITKRFQSEDDSASSSSESEYSGDDIGDVDFAEGINEIPKSKRKSKKSSRERAQPMTRAGVAYVGPEGQIFVLPENSNDKLSSKNTLNDGHLEKKQKKTKGRFVSAQGLLEKAGRKLQFVSKEKEDIESMGQRKQEVDLKRLRELEVQERLHRLETAKMQEQITRLQRQQLERSHANLNSTEQAESTDPMGSVFNNQAVFYDRTSLHSGSGFLPGQQTQQTNGGPGFGISPAHHRYSMPPSFPSNANPNFIGHRIATTTDPANYTAHTAPLVGGDSGLGSAPGLGPAPYTLSNFTAQELAYLSEYMRAMGVTPPSNQHQWAMLLNSFSFNNTTAAAPADKNAYHYNNMASLRPTENMLLKTPPVNNQNHAHLSSAVFGAGPNLSQTGRPSAFESGHQVEGLRPAASNATSSTSYPTHNSSQMASSKTHNSGPYNLNPVLTTDNNNPTSMTTSLNTARFDTGHMNGNLLNSNPSTQLNGEGLQDNGSHQLVNRQSFGSATSGREGVRTVSVANGVPAAGVYGPMGFRQIPT